MAPLQHFSAFCNVMHWYDSAAHPEALSQMVSISYTTRNAELCRTSADTVRAGSWICCMMRSLFNCSLYGIGKGFVYLWYESCQSSVGGAGSPSLSCVVTFTVSPHGSKQLSSPLAWQSCLSRLLAPDATSYQEGAMCHVPAVLWAICGLAVFLSPSAHMY